MKVTLVEVGPDGRPLEREAEARIFSVKFTLDNGTIIEVRNGTFGSGHLDVEALGVGQLAIVGRSGTGVSLYPIEDGLTRREP